MTTPEAVAVVTGVVGSLAAMVALYFTWAANKKSDKANEISRDANAIAARALHMQEDESRVRIIVEPRMMILIGDGDDKRPRPVVKVINLSKFPVTISGIHWSTGRPDKIGYNWKNPTVTSPYGSLPARLEPRAALTAVGHPDSFRSVEDLLAVTSCMVLTDCGEETEGMTDQWREYCARIVAESSAKPDQRAAGGPKT